MSAGAAQAATGPLSDLFPAGAARSAALSGVALPSVNAPLGLSDAALPLNQATLALAPTQAMVTGTQQLTDHLTSALPLNNLVPSVVPDASNPLQVAPNLLQVGALGNLSQGLAPQTQDLTGAVVGQTAPLVNGLHQAGVPTVGDVTGQVSQAALPGVGTIGGLTKSLPVTSVLGPDSPGHRSAEQPRATVGKALRPPPKSKEVHTFQSLDITLPKLSFTQTLPSSAETSADIGS